MQTTQQPLQPIVNGSFNHELSNEEMLAFDFPTKKHMTWCLIVSLGFAHSFRDTDPRVFVDVPSKYTHDMLVPEHIDEILVNVRTEFQQRHKQLLRLTSDFYYRQGKEIAIAQKELGFGGFLQMDFRKLLGYVSQNGSWNEFSHNDVCEAVRKLDQLAPKFYMRNNPNNGNKKHKWQTNGEYLIMEIDYISGEKEKNEFLAFYKDHFEPTGKAIKADSVRMEVKEYPNDVCALEFIMWWD